VQKNKTQTHTRTTSYSTNEKVIISHLRHRCRTQTTQTTRGFDTVHTWTTPQCFWQSVINARQKC